MISMGIELNEHKSKELDYKMSNLINTPYIIKMSIDENNKGIIFNIMTGMLDSYENNYYSLFITFEEIAYIRGNLIYLNYLNVVNYLLKIKDHKYRRKIYKLAYLLSDSVTFRRFNIYNINSNSRPFTTKLKLYIHGDNFINIKKLIKLYYNK